MSPPLPRSHMSRLSAAALLAALGLATVLPAAADNKPAPPPGLGDGSPYAARQGANRAELLAARGGTAESEAAVARGLAWLVKQQQKDGSWVFDAGNHKVETAASTGLALLPLLAAG